MANLSYCRALWPDFLHRTTFKRPEFLWSGRHTSVPSCRPSGTRGPLLRGFWRLSGCRSEACPSVLRIARAPHTSPSVHSSFRDRGCDSSPGYIVCLCEPCPQGLCLVVRRNSRGIIPVPSPRRSFPLQTTPSLASPLKVRGHCTGGGTSSWGD